MSQYEASAETIKSCEYFYYGWWRKFLYEFAYALLNVKALNSLPELEEYNYIISYIPALEKLDNIMGFANIDRASDELALTRYIIDIH